MVILAPPHGVRDCMKSPGCVLMDCSRLKPLARCKSDSLSSTAEGAGRRAVTSTPGRRWCAGARRTISGPAAFETLTSLLTYPAPLTVTLVMLSAAVSVNAPAGSVSVPFVVPVTTTKAPETGLPVCASTTVPCTVDWARRLNGPASRRSIAVAKAFTRGCSSGAEWIFVIWLTGRLSSGCAVRKCALHKGTPASAPNPPCYASRVGVQVASSMPPQQ